LNLNKELAVILSLSLRFAAAALPALLLAACASSSSTPALDAQFGNSVRAAIAAQLVDPAAVNNANPVAGLDGTAARNAQEKYQNSFVKPAETSDNTLLIKTK
jgi:hypothetical protein